MLYYHKNINFIQYVNVKICNKRLHHQSHQSRFFQFKIVGINKCGVMMNGLHYIYKWVFESSHCRIVSLKLDVIFFAKWFLNETKNVIKSRSLVEIGYTFVSEYLIHVTFRNKAYFRINVCNLVLNTLSCKPLGLLIIKVVKGVFWATICYSTLPVIK